MHMAKSAKPIRQHFTVQMDNDPKRISNAKEFLEAVKLDSFKLLNTNLKAEGPTNKQQLKGALIKIL